MTINTFDIVNGVLSHGKINMRNLYAINYYNQKGAREFLINSRTINDVEVFKDPNFGGDSWFTEMNNVISPGGFFVVTVNIPPEQPKHAFMVTEDFFSKDYRINYEQLITEIRNKKIDSLI